MAQSCNLLHIGQYIALILTVVSGGFAAKIGPMEEDANFIRKESDNVTLKCSYESNSDYIYLYWYKQHPNSEPLFLLYKGAKQYRSQESTPSDTRLKATATDTSTELTIYNLKLTDSALYHCTLRDPHIRPWGTEPLIFGKPISLTVNPKDVPVSLPVLSILVPKDGPEMCLAAGFFPREGELTLTLADNNKNENRNVSKAQLSKSKTYYYAAFASGSIKKCEMKGKSASKTSENSSSTASTTDECKTQAEPTTASNQDNDKKDEASSNVVTPKGNMMSVLVTGLRILLAKAVALNVMMTIKTFLV